MTKYMKMGFLYGVAIIGVFVLLAAINLGLGLIALAVASVWVWNMNPSQTIDADLKASNEVIDKELPEKPELIGKPYLVEEHSLIVEEPLQSFLSERAGSPRPELADTNVDVAAVRPPDPPQQTP